MADSARRPHWPKRNAAWVSAVDRGLIGVVVAEVAAIGLYLWLPLLSLVLFAVLPFAIFAAIATAGATLRRDKRYRKSWKKVWIALIAAGIAPAITVWTTPDIYDRSQMAPWFAGFIALFMAGYLVAAFRQRPYVDLGKGLFVALSASTVYALGLIAGINNLGPHQDLSTHRGVVIGKHIGRRGAQSVEVEFPSGDLQSQHFPQFIGQFDAIEIGDPYCLTLRSGRLGLRTYEPVSCQSARTVTDL